MDSPEIPNDVWQAILNRDRQYDGRFVYGVLTTGIYCRPSCPARRPHRRNTLVFSRTQDAEIEGFIACQRCFPTSKTPVETSIKAALDYIEIYNHQRITLKTLSQVTGLSPNHIQQSFRNIVGLSPKTFSDARRLTCLKQYLKRGDSVVMATYAAGYGSSRALYERANRGLGMTPAEYSRGGDKIRIEYTVLHTSLGSTLIAGAERGICAIIMGADEKQIVSELHREFPNAELSRVRCPLDKWAKAVQSSQQEHHILGKLPLDLRRKVFQARIRKALH